MLVVSGPDNLVSISVWGEERPKGGGEWRQSRLIFKVIIFIRLPNACIY